MQGRRRGLGGWLKTTREEPSEAEEATEMKMCLNWKVAAGLGAVAVGILLFEPHLFGQALPLLLLAVCPLSMLAMMGGMRGMGGMQGGQCSLPEQPDHARAASREERLAQLQAELGELKARQNALAAELRALDEAEPVVSAPAEPREPVRAAPRE
jgi:hypothetical protein